MSVISNRELADSIIAKADRFGKKYYEAICLSDSFLASPIDDLASRIIQDSGINRDSEDDLIRAAIIKKIPNFTQSVTTSDYLIKYAEKRFEAHPNRVDIMTIFHRSLAHAQFLERLKKANEWADKRKFYQAECELRQAFIIFKLAEHVTEYTEPNRKGPQKES